MICSIKRDVFILDKEPEIRLGKKIKKILKDNENLKELILKKFIKSLAIRRKMSKKIINTKSGVKKLKTIWDDVECFSQT